MQPPERASFRLEFPEEMQLVEPHMVVSQPLFPSLAGMIFCFVIGLVVLAVGVAAIVSAAKGSRRYRYVLSALGVTVALCFLGVWLNQEFGNFSLHKTRAYLGAIDPTAESMDLAGYYLPRACLVLIGGMGMVLGAISLLLRKGG